MLTVGQLKEDPIVAEAALATGSDPRFLVVVNRAVETLMRMGDFTDALQEYCFNSCHKCIYVPPEIVAIRRVRINGRPARVFDRVFQYIENGPAGSDWCGPEALVDKGTSLFFFDQPDCPQHIQIVTDECEDDGKWLRISGIDAYNRPVIGPAGKPFVEFNLGSGQAQSFTTTGFRELTDVSKSITRGNVYIYQIDPSTEQVGNLLTVIHPWQTVPEYRRYEVKGTGDGEFSVTMLAKRRHVPLYHDNQAVFVDSREAIIAALNYNRALDSRDSEGMQLYRTEIDRIMLDLRRNQDDGQTRRFEFSRGVRFAGFRRLGGR